MYIESLRRRRLRHVVAVKLDLLTYLLPILLPSQATSGNLNNRRGSAASYESRLKCSSNETSRIRWLGRQLFRRRIFQSTLRSRIGVKSASPENLLIDGISKQPPSSVESLMDSGIAFSEGSLHSIPSLESALPTRAAASPSDAMADQSYSKEESLSPAPVKPPYFFPEVYNSPLRSTFVDFSATSPLLANSLMSNANKSNGILPHSLKIKRTLKDRSNLGNPSVHSPANCCIPS